MKAFIDNNCVLFDGETNGEYSHVHHEIWQEFMKKIDGILSNLVSDIGGNVEELESALRQEASQRARGPRDGNRKELMKQIMTFDDFRTFCEMMKCHCKACGGDVQTPGSVPQTPYSLVPKWPQPQQRECGQGPPRHRMEAAGSDCVVYLSFKCIVAQCRFPCHREAAGAVG